MNIRNLFPFKKKEDVKRRNTVNVNYVGQRTYKYVPIKNPDVALTNSVIYRGVSILSDSVASIPLSVYHKSVQGYWEQDEANTLNYILGRKPNKKQTIYELLERNYYSINSIGECLYICKPKQCRNKRFNPIIT